MAHFRAANAFRHDSERRVAEGLAKALPAEGQVIGNYMLPGRRRGGEIDLVVVLASGIVAVEVKCWRGRVLRMGRLVEFDNGFSPPNPLDGLQYKAKELRGHLIDIGIIDGSVPVGACLIHTGGALEWPEEVRRTENIFDERAAVERLSRATPFPEWKKSALPAARVAAIADRLAASSSGADLWRVGHFVIDEEVAGTAFARQFVGRCEHVRERDILLRCWEVDPLADAATRHRTIRRFEQEAAALARLERRRCRALPIVYDAFTDPGNFNVFWTALESNGRRTLAAERRRFNEERSFCVSVIEDLDEALGALAAAGLCHRNLSADVITVGEDGGILIGGLEYSTATDATTFRRTVASPGRQPPEAVKGAKDSTAGDRYQAGLLVLDLLVDGNQPHPQRLRRIESKPVRRALDDLLATDPSRRPADLTALRAAFAEGIR